MFFLVVFSIWGSVLAHILLRTRGLLRLRGWRVAAMAAVLFAGGFGYIPARIVLATGRADALASALEYAASWCVGIASIVWTLLVAFEACAVVVWLVSRRRVRDLSLRAGRSLAAVLWGATLVLAVTGFLVGRSTPTVTRLQVTAPGAEAGRFAVIVDSHLGAISSPGQWRRTLEAVRDLEPDALLIPGDLIDDHSSYTEPQVRLIRDLFPSLPVYVTTGNHEFYAGTDRFVDLCRRSDLLLLRQEKRPLIPGLTVAGIDDLHLLDARDAVDRLALDPGGPVLLLTHRPAAVERVRDRPMTLALAGHTHGGQIPPMVFVVGLGNGGFHSGHYRVGQAHLYLSRGTGVWGPPMRLLAPPELVLLEVADGPGFDVKVF